MKIFDLFDMRSLGEMIQGGFVRSQTHPDYPQLVILNYTETCAYQRIWNEITTACRGFIYDSDTGEILARPFSKFFNYSEPGAPFISLDYPVEVTDKLDGSLGILFPSPDGYAIATRGSFDSEQARHATAILRDRYADRFFAPGVTYLFEIIYRENRIVVDYGQTDDLFLLGAVDIETGYSCGPGMVGDWPGPRASTFGFSTFAEALAAPPRKNSEGLVVRQLGTENRVKIKQEDYIQLHRIVTGCTKRRLWEQLVVWENHEMTDKDLTRRFFLGPERIKQIRATGEDWLDDYLSSTPEEFRSWVEVQIREMEDRVSARECELRGLFTILCQEAEVESSDSPGREDSKRFATLVRDRVDEATFHLIMTMWRGHSLSSALWREVYPAHELPYRVIDQEA